MSAPAVKDISLWRGNTEDLRFVLKTDATNALNLDGSTFIFTIFHDGGKIVKTLGSGITIANPLNGTIDVHITVAESRAIAGDVAPAYYDLERRIGLSEKTILTGKITMSGGQNND